MKFDKTKLDEHLKINVGSEYGAAIVCSALYKKIYGEFPKLGLSGFQGEAAQFVFESLPEPKSSQAPQGKTGFFIDQEKAEMLKLAIECYFVCSVDTNRGTKKLADVFELTPLTNIMIRALEIYKQ